MASNNLRINSSIPASDEDLTQADPKPKWNTFDDVYILPADEEESSRLDRQHMAIRTALGKLYPFPEVIEPLLLFSEGGSKRILDVGCGSGAWTLDMAKLYPNVSILGIDLAPPTYEPSKLPPNVTFKTQNFNEDISEYYDQFDLIHMRFLNPFVDIDKTFTELERCLKPGGALITIDMIKEMRTETLEKVKIKRIKGDDETSGVSKEGSWLRRMHWELGEAIDLSGIDTDRHDAYRCQGLWDHTLLDSETATHAWLFMPIGPWAKTENAEETLILQTAGEYMRQSISSIHRAWHKALRRPGLSQETLDEWSNGVQEELDTMSFHHSLRILISCARRRAGDGLSAPPLPTLPTEQANNFTQKSVNGFKSPWYETFNSAEEVTTARVKRHDASTKELGTSAVMRAVRDRSEQIKAKDAES